MTFTTPVISTDLAFTLARAVVGLVVAAHGAQKLFGVWGGPGLQGWTAGVNRMGMRPAPFWALTSALAEFAGGLALAVGLLVPIAAAVVTMQMLVAIAKVHWVNGFWATKGGLEFNLVLAAVAAISGVADPGTWSLDRQLGVPTFGAGAFVVALAISWLAYLVGSRPRSAQPAGAPKAA